MDIPQSLFKRSPPAYIFFHFLAQKYPIVRPHFVNNSHAGQKQLICFIGDETDDFPRAQKSALGADAKSRLFLNVGQAPQYFLQISRFSSVSSTGLAVSDIFMGLFTTKYYCAGIILLFFWISVVIRFTRAAKYEGIWALWIF